MRRASTSCGFLSTKTISKPACQASSPTCPRPVAPAPKTTILSACSCHRRHLCNRLGLAPRRPTRACSLPAAARLRRPMARCFRPGLFSITSPGCSSDAFPSSRPRSPIPFAARPHRRRCARACGRGIAGWSGCPALISMILKAYLSVWATQISRPHGFSTILIGLLQTVDS